MTSQTLNKIPSDLGDLSDLPNGLDIGKQASDCACCGASASISAYVYLLPPPKKEVESRKKKKLTTPDPGTSAPTPNQDSPAQISGPYSSPPTYPTSTPQFPTGPGQAATPP